MNHVLVDASSVALFWEIQGTHEGRFLGIDPTHRRLRFAGAFLYEIANGEIVRERRIVDLIGVIQEALDRGRHDTYETDA